MRSLPQSASDSNRHFGMPCVTSRSGWPLACRLLNTFQNHVRAVTDSLPLTLWHPTVQQGHCHARKYFTYAIKNSINQRKPAKTILVWSPRHTCKNCTICISWTLTTENTHQFITQQCCQTSVWLKLKYKFFYHTECTQILPFAGKLQSVCHVMHDSWLKCGVMVPLRTCMFKLVGCTCFRLFLLSEFYLHADNRHTASRLSKFNCCDRVPSACMKPCLPSAAAVRCVVSTAMICTFATFAMHRPIKTGCKVGDANKTAVDVDGQKLRRQFSAEREVKADGMSSLHPTQGSKRDWQDSWAS